MEIHCYNQINMISAEHLSSNGKNKVTKKTSLHVNIFDEGKKNFSSTLRSGSKTFTCKNNLLHI